MRKDVLGVGLVEIAYILLQWTLVITNSLGPVKLLLFNISGLQDNKIQRNFELWDQENYFVIHVYRDFVIYISDLYNESPL